MGLSARLTPAMRRFVEAIEGLRVGFKGLLAEGHLGR